MRIRLVHGLSAWLTRRPWLLTHSRSAMLYRAPVTRIRTDEGNYMTASLQRSLGVVARRRYLVLGALSFDEARAAVGLTPCYSQVARAPMRIRRGIEAQPGDVVEFFEKCE